MSVKLDRRAFLGTALTFGAVCAVAPTSALGVSSSEIKAQIQDVKSQLDSLSSEIDEAGEAYNKAMNDYDVAVAKVEACQKKIEKAEAKIAQLQERLETRAMSMYRSGNVSYLDVLMGVESFDDFATVWDTLNNLNEDDADLVAETKVTKAELESAKKELDEQEKEAEDQLAAARSYKNSLEAKQAEYNDLYDSLSAKYKRVLQQEREAADRASARAARAYSPSVSNGGGGGDDGDDDDDGDGGGGGSNSSGGGSSAPASSIPTNGSVVDYAASRLGCAYVWGASGPNEFDCSGLVMWCYNKIGISLPHYTEGQYACAQARMSPNSASAGDVLYHPGHVGISTGGINCIEAMGSNYGVVRSCRGSWTAALRF